MIRRFAAQHLAACVPAEVPRVCAVFCAVIGVLHFRFSSLTLFLIVVYRPIFVAVDVVRRRLC